MAKELGEALSLADDKGTEAFQAKAKLAGVECRALRWEGIARAALRSRRYWRRLANALMDGEFDCPSCGCVTNNGICTGCRHGTSEVALLRKRVAELEGAGTAPASTCQKCNASACVAPGHCDDPEHFFGGIGP